MHCLSSTESEDDRVAGDKRWACESGTLLRRHILRGQRIIKVECLFVISDLALEIDVVSSSST